MSGTVEKLIQKTKEEPYWGTGGSKGGTFNVDKMQKVKKREEVNNVNV